MVMIVGRSQVPYGTEEKSGTDNIFAVDTRLLSDQSEFAGKQRLRDGAAG
jgi:hypothetical protein